MPARDPAQLKQYIELISKNLGGIEGLREIVRKEAETESAFESGFEAIGSEPVEPKAPQAAAALESMEMSRDVMPPGIDALEAIIDEKIRPVIDVIGGKFTSTHELWKHLNSDAGIRQRLEDSMKSIGRIELPGRAWPPYAGTGFVVGKNRMMTNRHVAEIFATGLGTRELRFKPDFAPAVDFIRERGSAPGQQFTVKQVLMIHPYWDMAILEVDGLVGTDRGLLLSLEDARDLQNRQIAVVGYPAFDGRNPTDVQNQLFNHRFGIKRLQPGELKGGFQTGSFKKLVKAATHDCSTLGGNSGSALIDLTTGHVIGLHFGGLYHERNFAVPAFELSRDQRVIDAGVEFAGAPRADGTDWADWWRRADATEAVANDGEGGKGGGNDPATSSPAASGPSGPAKAIRTAEGDELDVEIPIRIRISIGAARKAVSAAAATESLTAETADVLEAMKEPEHDTNYQTRKGYDSKFLGNLEVPMPGAADPAVLAKTNDGADILHYQNFSVRMHAKRRLALVTAANVTTEPQLREPEAGKNYTRKGLSGLGKNDSEKWFLDTRLDEKFQIPDAFFTNDRKAFDKGHLCRRDDVCWGKTYEEVKRANGDTYHVTNCSPQVKGFNQSQHGDENWGDLENHVLTEAENERLCVFAGPILADNDTVFHGTAGGGKKLLSRIPNRFWKVIVAKVAGGLAAFGFILEQDLTDVQFQVEEFTVGDEFLPSLRSLTEISQLTGVSFAPAIMQADQFATLRGLELLQRTGLRRK